MFNSKRDEIRLLKEELAKQKIFRDDAEALVRELQAKSIAANANFGLKIDQLTGELDEANKQITTYKTLAEHNQTAAEKLPLVEAEAALARGTVAELVDERVISNEQMAEIIKLNTELVNTQADLVTAHGQIEDLAYENDDLNRIVDLYDSLFHILRVPVKLTARKRGK